MGFSIRSELASYARLKRRCYFLFVISYGGLLAGLTYAAMTHQSPPLWIGLIPGAALSVPLLLLPTQSWLPCLFHVLLGVVFAPIICARREADLSLIEAVELGAVAGLALIYPFYILCSTLEKEGTLKKYAPDRSKAVSERLPFTSHPPASFIREAGGILLGFWHFSGPYVENRVRGSLKPTLSLLCTLPRKKLSCRLEEIRDW